MSKSYWIWHPGAFELYHSMLLHNRRTSAHNSLVNGETKRRSIYYPPMWRIDGPSHNAELQKTATISQEETIVLISNTEHCSMVVDGKKYEPGVPVTLGVHCHCRRCGQGHLHQYPFRLCRDPKDYEYRQRPRRLEV